MSTTLLKLYITTCVTDSAYCVQCITIYPYPILVKNYPWTEVPGAAGCPSATPMAGRSTHQLPSHSRSLSGLWRHASMHRWCCPRGVQSAAEAETTRHAAAGYHWRRPRHSSHDTRTAVLTATTHWHVSTSQKTSPESTYFDCISMYAKSSAERVRPSFRSPTDETLSLKAAPLNLHRTWCEKFIWNRLIIHQLLDCKGRCT